MEKFFKDWLLAWTGNRPQELLEFYHDSVFYRDPAFPQGIQGKARLGAYLEKLLARHPHWEWSLVAFDSVSESRFYIKWKAKIPFAGQMIEEEGLDLVEVKDQKIICNEVYFDATQISRRSGTT